MACHMLVSRIYDVFAQTSVLATFTCSLISLDLLLLSLATMHPTMWLWPIVALFAVQAQATGPLSSFLSATVTQHCFGSPGHHLRFEKHQIHQRGYQLLCASGEKMLIAPLISQKF